MQTFLPYPDFEASAKALDYRRLGKQRVEAMQLLNVLNNPDAKGWRNHPAVKMWRGYEYELALYGLTMSVEFYERGFDGYAMMMKFTELCNELQNTNTEKYPWFIGFEPLHTSHKSNLYRKDPEHYARYASVGNELPYVWCEDNGFFRIGKKVA